MPVYQVGEHEILKEEASYGYAENEYYDGMLYLSDKRLVFEKKGKRGLIHATPPQVVLDVQLHEISNISSAVPKIKVFTKKVLTVEYQSEKDVLKARFLLPDPSKWETEIRKWIADSKRQEEERIKREQDEIYRKRVEMARAKSGTTNVGALVLIILGVILHYNSKKKKSMKTEAKVEEPKTTPEQEPAPDTKEETPVEEAKTQDDAVQQKE